jgi:hypothetical protein
MSKQQIGTFVSRILGVLAIIWALGGQRKPTLPSRQTLQQMEPISKLKIGSLSPGKMAL